MPVTTMLVIPFAFHSKKRLSSSRQLNVSFSSAGSEYCVSGSTVFPKPLEYCLVAATGISNSFAASASRLMFQTMRSNSIITSRNASCTSTINIAVLCLFMSCGLVGNAGILS